MPPMIVLWEDFILRLFHLTTFAVKYEITQSIGQSSPHYFSDAYSFMKQICHTHLYHDPFSSCKGSNAKN